MIGKHNKNGELLRAKDIFQVFERVDRLSRAKTHSVTVADYICELLDKDEYLFGTVNKKMEKLFNRVSPCSNWLRFRHYTEHDESRLTAGNFCCKHLLCQSCAIRRGALLLQKHHSNIENVLLENKGLKAWMLTFTVKNGEDLLERFNHLQKFFKLLQKRRQYYIKDSSRNAYTEFSKIEGAIFSYEFKRGEDDLWHPHIHLLILAYKKPDMGFVNFNDDGSYDSLSSSGLRKEWYEITGDSYQVDCRRKRGGKLIDMCFEVMKYATKFTEQSVQDTWYLFRLFNGRNMFGSFGLLRGVKIPNNLLDTELTGPYYEFTVKYVLKYHRYLISDVLDATEDYETPY